MCYDDKSSVKQVGTTAHLLHSHQRSQRHRASDLVERSTPIPRAGLEEPGKLPEPLVGATVEYPAYRGGTSQPSVGLLTLLAYVATKRKLGRKVSVESFAGTPGAISMACWPMATGGVSGSISAALGDLNMVVNATPSLLGAEDP